jgi:hypothetical protein
MKLLPIQVVDHRDPGPVLVVEDNSMMEVGNLMVDLGIVCEVGTHDWSQERVQLGVAIRQC